MCAGHSSQVLLVNQSPILIRQLLHDPLPDPVLPANGDQLADWLFGFNQLKVPVTSLFYQYASSVSQNQYLAPQDDAASAVITFTDLLQTAPRLPYHSGMHTPVYICNFMGRVWGSLTEHSPTNLRHSFLFNNPLQQRSVSSNAITPKSRPDTMLVATTAHSCLARTST